MFLDQLLRKSGIPGASVAISAAGETMAVCAGVADVESKAALTENTRFDSGCLSKHLIAIVALEFVRSGKLSLDAPIATCVPELGGHIADRICMRHLLSHTAGYQEENLADPDVQSYSWEEFAESFSGKAMLFPPGAVFDYSHSGTVVVARALRNLCGREAHELIRTEILDVLSASATQGPCSDSTEQVSGHRAHGARRELVKLPPREWSDFWSPSLGCVSVTMSELARIGAEIVAPNGRFRGIYEQLTSRAARLPKLIGGARHGELPYAFGPGCGEYLTGTFGYGSSTHGQTCALRFHPSTGISVAVGLNVNEPYTRDFLINKLLNALLPQGDLPRAAVEPYEASTFALEELTGVFHGAAYRTFIGTLEDGRLILKPGHNPAISHSAAANVIIALNEHGVPVAHSSAQLPIGFFREPDRNSPCLMFGMNAFRKLD